MKNWIVLLSAMLAVVTAESLSITTDSDCGQVVRLDGGQSVTLKYEGGALNTPECQTTFTIDDTTHHEICLRPNSVNLHCGTEIQYHTSSKLTCANNDGTYYSETCDRYAKRFSVVIKQHVSYPTTESAVIRVYAKSKPMADYGGYTDKKNGLATKHDKVYPTQRIATENYPISDSNPNPNPTAERDVWIWMASITFFVKFVLMCLCIKHCCGSSSTTITANTNPTSDPTTSDPTTQTGYAELTIPGHQGFIQPTYQDPTGPGYTVPQHAEKYSVHTLEPPTISPNQSAPGTHCDQYEPQSETSYGIQPGSGSFPPEVFPSDHIQDDTMSTPSFKYQRFE